MIGKLSRFKYSPARRMLGFTHATSDGGPVLKSESSWRTINGIWYNTPRHGWIIWEFRRIAWPSD